MPLAPISVLEDAQQRAAAREVLAAGAEAAAQCAGRVADQKPAVKDLTAAVESMCEAMGEDPEDEDGAAVVDDHDCATVESVGAGVLRNADFNAPCVAEGVLAKTFADAE